MIRYMRRCSGEGFQTVRNRPGKRAVSVGFPFAEPVRELQSGSRWR